MASAPSAPTTAAPQTAPPPPPPNITAREQAKIEFYRSYDVMTGVRIAATLGGFFGLMVLLVVYKSKSKTEKVLTDPKLAAAVVEAEEERQLNAALEATAEFACLNPRGPRRSLGNTSAPLMTRYTRFSSVGDPGSLMAPPVRELGHPQQHRLLLDVPGSRRVSDVSSCRRLSDVSGCRRVCELAANRRISNATTCSSSDSSYLERRGSSIALGLPVIPPLLQQRRRQSSPIAWDACCRKYPIDIRVIQPTPGGSPCGSERTLHQNPRGPAPLASISSCASSLAVDYPDLDARSFGSDSVFLDDEECLDTDDEVTQFSTDSDTETITGGCDLQVFDRPKVQLQDQASSSVDVDDGSWSQETLF